MEDCPSEKPDQAMIRRCPMEDCLGERLDPAVVAIMTRNVRMLKDAISVHRARGTIHDVSGTLQDITGNTLNSTLLHFAAENHAECVHALLSEHGDVFDVNVRDGSLSTPLHSAVRSFRGACVDVLIHYVCDVNAIDAKGETPLMAACLQADIPMVHRLLRGGANVLVPSMCPPILSAVGCSRCLVALLEANADPNMINMNCDTPLHIAARIGAMESARLLVIYGANRNRRNSCGQTPHETAICNGKRGTARIIDDAEWHPECPCDEIETGSPMDTDSD